MPLRSLGEGDYATENPSHDKTALIATWVIPYH